MDLQPSLDLRYSVGRSELWAIDYSRCRERTLIVEGRVRVEHPPDLERMVEFPKASNEAMETDRKGHTLAFKIDERHNI